MDTTTPVYYTKQGEIMQHLQGSGPLAGHLPPEADSKNKKPRSVFYMVQKPIICSLRFFGGFPYTVKDDKLQVRLCSCWTIYSVIVIIIQITLLIISSHRIYIGSSDFFDNKLFATINIVVAVCQAFGPLIFWYQSPKVAKYFTKWYDYQEELRLCGVELDTKLKRKSILIMLYLVPSVLTSSYYQSVVHGGRLHLPAIVVFLSITGLSLSICIISCLFIKSVSSSLIQRMKQLIITRDNRGIAACRNLWLTLADLTADLGCAMGPTLLEFMLLACAIVIICSYFLMFLLRGELAEVEFSLGGPSASRIYFILMSSISVYSLCEFGHRSTTAVGSDFLHELLRLNLKPQESDLRREIKSFIQTVCLRYPNLELCGFVTLNRRLIVSLVSTGITYLIVLVQFRSQDMSSNCQPTVLP